MTSLYRNILSDFLRFQNRPHVDADIINARSESELHYSIHRGWSFLVDGANAVPVWVNYFSTPNDGRDSDEIFAWLKNYLIKHDLDWSYWQISGDEGVLDSSWSAPAGNGWLIHQLQGLQECRRQMSFVPRPDVSAAQVHHRARENDADDDDVVAFTTNHRHYSRFVNR